MSLADQIPVRKSTRAYLNQPLDQAVLDQILAFVATIQPLDASRRTDFRLADRSQVTRLMPAAAPHYGLLFSSDQVRDLIELGFRYQQLDLYLHHLGLGSCWLGNAKPKADGVSDLPYQAMISFGTARGQAKRQPGTAKRKPLAEISSTADSRLEAARLAPSAINQQAWYFETEGNLIHLYGQTGGVKQWLSSRWIPIDLGIALCHVWLTQPDWQYDYYAELAKPGRIYGGTIRLG